jgi:hypothetical protein
LRIYESIAKRKIDGWKGSNRIFQPTNEQENDLSTLAKDGLEATE